ncbi:MAG: monovalent cation/H+ antiporter subunit D family protein [Desulfurivibrionaceae bacterium]
MISESQIPVIIIVAPLLGVLLVNVFGLFSKKSGICLLLTAVVLLIASAASLKTLFQVMENGVIGYRMGGWPPPFGIEYVIDHLNALVLVVVNAVSLIAVIFSGRSVKEEIPSYKIPLFYSILILLVTGLSGITITGDAFNLYVLLEISALTGYALIAVGRDHALMASFNYLLLGTIGASLYLLGTGHLYIMTGSLNMGDLSVILTDLYGSRAILIALLLILVGTWIKMAFFPLHTWLPNSYTYAPTATSCIAAPLVTKVSVYIMLRAMFSIFTPNYVYDYLDLSGLIVWLAVVAIVMGSLLALAQKDLKRMLSYVLVAEVGYMVGGAWLANSLGLTGTILHIVNDALMTLCLFMAAGTINYRTGDLSFSSMGGLYKKMPFTMTAFTIGALSMIGVPPTAGFFSKWYLILGAVEAGRWEYMGALLFSSLVNVVLFFRIFEIAYFDGASEERGENRKSRIAEAPLSMVAPLWIVAVSLIVIGIYTGDLVSNVIQYAVPIG